MFDSTRRCFLRQTSIGLATFGVSGLILRADALPTQAVTEEQSKNTLIKMGPMPKETTITKADLKKTTPQPYGPFYREGAPFRGKLSLPGEPGTTFVLSGRVWAFDTKRPLPGVVMDFWHVDLQEKYSNGTTDFRNRGRLVCRRFAARAGLRSGRHRSGSPARPSSGAARIFIFSRPVQSMSR